MSRFDQLEMRMDSSDRRVDKLEGIPLQETDYMLHELLERSKIIFRGFTNVYYKKQKLLVFDHI